MAFSAQTRSYLQELDGPYVTIPDPMSVNQAFESLSVSRGFPAVSQCVGRGLDSGHWPLTLPASCRRSLPPCLLTALVSLLQREGLNLHVHCVNIVCPLGRATGCPGVRLSLPISAGARLEARGGRHDFPRTACRGPALTCPVKPQPPPPQSCGHGGRSGGWSVRVHLVLSGLAAPSLRGMVCGRPTFTQKPCSWTSTWRPLGDLGRLGSQRRTRRAEAAKGSSILLPACRCLCGFARRSPTSQSPMSMDAGASPAALGAGGVTCSPRASDPLGLGQPRTGLADQPRTCWPASDSAPHPVAAPRGRPLSGSSTRSSGSGEPQCSHRQRALTPGRPGAPGAGGPRGPAGLGAGWTVVEPAGEAGPASAPSASRTQGPAGRKEGRWESPSSSSRAGNRPRSCK